MSAVDAEDEFERGYLVGNRDGQEFGREQERERIRAGISRGHVFIKEANGRVYYIADEIDALLDAEPGPNLTIPMDLTGVVD